MKYKEVQERVQGGGEKSYARTRAHRIPHTIQEHSDAIFALNALARFTSHSEKNMNRGEYHY